MRVGLYNLEPKYSNLALEKLRIYHAGLGDDVVDYPWPEPCGKVYASSIFTFTKKHNVPEGSVVGGTGFNLSTVLPADVAAIKPHLNFGFTTRGCIRKCPFCVVPEKEGAMRIEGDLLDLWDGKSKDVVLFDNNILGLPVHFALICQQAREHKLRIDFNQGLDHRLLTPRIIADMSTISHPEFRFAYDHVSMADSVEKAIALLREGGAPRRSMWYVLVGYDSTFDEDLQRLKHLRSMGQNAYVQRYVMNDRRLTALAQWANQRHIFHGMTWEQFISHPRKKGYRELFNED